MANQLTFMDNQFMYGLCGYEVSALPPSPGMWDRQTLVFLCQSKQIYQQVRENVRHRHRPSSTSEGKGYEIDVYTNLDYKMGERDPAMRNIRAVYCDESILTLKALNERFPNSYIVRVREEKREEPVYDITRRSIGEVFKIPSRTGCP